MSAIAKDSSITLITAVPGSGKTLRTVWYVREALKQGEQVFVCNVNGLIAEGEWAGWVPFDDPTRWEELPAGAVLVVDEAQQFFRAKAGNVPEYIAAMETIRHRGVRMILITQHPALLHTNIRALVGRHEHLVREEGKESSVMYRRNGVIDNVRSDKSLHKEDFATWVFPKDCYHAYKSAEIHTVKRTFRYRDKRGLLLLIVAAIAVGVVVYRIKTRVASDAPPVATSEPAQAGQGAPFGALGNKAVRTAEQYAVEFTPVIPEMPWTMPATMDREVLVQPTVVCMAFGHNGADGCKCMTEQGTRYELEQGRCWELARHGPAYNPFKNPSNTINGQPMQQPTPTPVAGGAFPVMAPTGAASSSAAMISSEQVSGYGRMAAGQADSASR